MSFNLCASFCSAQQRNEALLYGITNPTFFFFWILSTLLGGIQASEKGRKKLEKSSSTSLLNFHASQLKILPDRSQELLIPADENALYKSIIVVYLFPVVHDIDLFSPRLMKLIGKKRTLFIEENKYSQVDCSSPARVDDLWDASLMQDTLLNLDTGTLLSYLCEDKNFARLVKRMKQHMGIGRYPSGEKNKLQKIADHLQVTIEKYTHDYENHRKLIGPEYFNPAKNKSKLSLFIVRDFPTQEEVISASTDKELKQTQLSYSQNSQVHHHYRALFWKIPNFLTPLKPKLPHVTTDKQCNPITISQSISVKKDDYKQNGTWFDHMEDQESAVMFAKKIKEGVKETKYYELFTGLKGLELLKVEDVLNPRRVMEILLEALTCQEIAWEAYHIKRYIAQAMRPFVYSMYRLAKKKKTCIYSVSKKRMVRHIENTIKLIDEKKSPGNGLRFELEVVKAMVGALPDEISKMEQWKNSLIATVGAIKDKDFSGLFQVLKDMYKPIKQKKGEKWYEVVLYIDYLKKVEKERVEALRLIQSILYYYEQRRSKPLTEQNNEKKEVKLLKVMRKCTAKYSYTNPGGDWHILYAGIDALTYIVQHVNKNNEKDIIKLALDSKDQDRPGLAYYFDFNKLNVLGIKTDNWRIREKAFESAFLLKHHHNEMVRKKATELLNNYKKKEKDKKVSLIFNNSYINNMLEFDRRLLEKKKNYELKKRKTKEHHNNLTEQVKRKEKLINEKDRSIAWLLNMASEIVVLENSGKVPFFILAARNSNLPVLKNLKLNGVDMNAKTKQGENALHWAIQYKADTEVIEWLIKVAHMNVNEADHSQRTPFLLATETGNLQALKLLKKAKANVGVTDKKGRSALHLAIEHGVKHEIIEWFIDEVKVNLELRGGDTKRTPFLCAAAKGNQVILKLLQKKGAHVDATDENGRNALHLAIFSKVDPKIIEWLIDVVKVSVDSKDVYQKTSFLYAAEKGNLPVLKLLQKKGAHVNATSQYSCNALHWAIGKGVQAEIVEWLIDVAKVNIDSKAGHGKLTPFLFAVAKGNLPALKLLKDRKANVDATDQDGRNALHLAIEYGVKDEITEWLIDVAKVNIESKAGKNKRTPFLSFAEKGNLPVLKLLKARKTNVGATDKKGRNALHLAIEYGVKTEIIEWLIDVAKVNIESKVKSKTTPFLFATAKGNLPVLKLLKARKANVNATDKKGRNALHLAIGKGIQTEIIEWLIDVAKVNIESKVKSKTTPFLYAAEKGSLPVLKLLHKKGAHVDVTDRDGRNALHLAIEYSVKNEIIEWLIDVAKVNIESKVKGKTTPFLYAAEKGNLPVLKLLHKKRANVDATDQDGSNALHLTIEYGVKSEIIEWLIDVAKVNIESKVKSKTTPFLFAAAKGNLPVLKLLKEKKANVNATDEYSCNALHWAIEYGVKNEIIEWLVDVAKVNIESKMKCKTTPFLYAASKGNLPILKFLKARKANVDATDQDGMNALHWAIDQGVKPQIIEWLVDVAKVNVESKNGGNKLTPFLLAAAKGNLPVLKLLKEKEAKINVKDQYGHNACWYAKNNLKIINWLREECNLRGN